MRRSTLLAALLLAGGPVLADSLTPLGGDWGRYVNARFGTSLDVPLNVFEAEPPPENGDGRAFRGADGARLEVYGTHAPSALMSPFDAYAEGLRQDAEAGGLDVTYARDGKGWAVFSGLKGAQIVYAKAIDACEASHVFVVTYPAERKAFYDPIVTRLSRSLRCRASR